MSILDVTCYAFAITDPKSEKKSNCKTGKKPTKSVDTSFSAHLVMHCLIFTVLIKLQLKFEKVLIRNTFLKMLEHKILLLEIFWILSCLMKKIFPLKFMNTMFYDLKNENITLPEAFVAGALIEKLSDLMKRL